MLIVETLIWCDQIEYYYGVRFSDPREKRETGYPE